MFLLMTDGGWHCQGTARPGRRQLPATCTPPLQPHTHTHTLPAFSLGLSLLNTGAPLSPPQTHTLPMCLSASCSITLSVCLSVFLTHWHSCPPPHLTPTPHLPSPSRVPMMLPNTRGCLRTDIHRPGSAAHDRGASILPRGRVGGESVAPQAVIQREDINKLFQETFLSAVSRPASQSKIATVSVLPGRLMRDGGRLMMPFIFMGGVAGFCGGGGFHPGESSSLPHHHPNPNHAQSFTR